MPNSPHSDNNKKIKLTNKTIMGVGNPLLDILTNVPREFLEKYALKMNNAILIENDKLHMFEELQNLNSDIKYIAGGSTLNSMRVCQWALKNSGNEQIQTLFMGSIGKDKEGGILKEYAKRDGVKTVFLESDTEKTGTCGVCIHNKERTMFTHLAAANSYKSSHIQKMWSSVENASIFYISGYFLTVSPETIYRIGEHAQKNDKIFCINISAEFIPEFFSEPLLKALKYSNYVFMNESEAVKYAETCLKKSDMELEDIAMELANIPSFDDSSMMKRTVVITRGKNSTIVAKCADATQKEKKKRVECIPVDPLIDQNTIVDLNGAGDAFVGGFLLKLVLGSSIEECVVSGHNAAGYVIQRSGVDLESDDDIDDGK